MENIGGQVLQKMSTTFLKPRIEGARVGNVRRNFQRKANCWNIRWAAKNEIETE